MSNVGGDLSKIETGPCKITFLGEVLGHTMEGVKLSAKPMLRDRKVDENGDHVIEIVSTGHGLEAKVVFGEKTVTVLRRVIAMSTAVSSTSRGIGRRPGTKATSVAGPLVIHPLSNDDGDETDDVVLHLCVAVDVDEVQAGQVLADRLFGCTFRSMVDETKPNGEILGRLGVITNTTPANTAPTIVAPADQSVNEDGSLGPLSFAVGDDESAASELTVTAATSNAAIIPLSGITLGGSGASRTITIAPAANASGSVTITLTVSDGELESSDTFTVTVNAVNDAPVITASGGSLAYTEGDAATVVDPGLTIADIDDTNIESAIMQISGNYQNGQDVLAAASADGITVNWSAGSGTLSFTGSATKAQYQARMRSATYVNNSENPNTSNRTIRYSVYDGVFNSNYGTKTVTVSAVNDASVLNVTGTPLDYTAEDAAVAIDTGLTVVDVDNANIASGYVQITGGYENGADVLDVTEASGITKSWNATNGRLTLTGSATKANWQALLRAVTFYTDGAEGDRTITFLVNDGTANSNAPTRVIEVAAGSLPPPNAPEGFDVFAYGLNPRFALNAGWSAPSAGPTPDGYEVRMSEDTEATWEDASVALTDVITETVELFELNHSTTYKVFVAAYVLDGMVKVYGAAVTDTEATASNGAPTFEYPDSDPFDTVVDGSSANIMFDIFATDPDGDGITYTVQSHDVPGGQAMIISPEGVLYRDEAPPPVGSHTIVIRADDGYGGYVDNTINLTVIPQPPITVLVAPDETNPYEKLNVTWEASPTAGVTGYRVFAMDYDGDFSGATLIATVAAPGLSHQITGIGPATYRKVWVKAYKTLASDYESALSEPGVSETQSLIAPTVTAPAAGDVHYVSDTSAIPGVDDSITSGAAPNPEDWFTFEMPFAIPAAEVTATISTGNGFTMTMAVYSGLTFTVGAFEGSSTVTFKGSEADVAAAIEGGIAFINPDAPTPASCTPTLELSNAGGTSGPISYTLFLDGP